MTSTRSRTTSARGAVLARRIIGLLVLVAATWGTLLAAMPATGGDPVLVSMTPSDGEFVKSPDDVRVLFDRPVPAGLATVRMTDPSGEQAVEGRPYNPPGEPNTIAVAMPKTRYAGTYSVAWSVPSSWLEPISGTFNFSVSQEGKYKPDLPQIATERDPVVVAVHTAFRLAATAALVLGVGVILVLMVVWPAGLDHAPARRLITYAWVGLVVSTLGTIASFGGYAARTTVGDAFDPHLLWATFASDIGGALLVRLLVLLPVTVGLVLLMTSPPADTPARRWSGVVAVLGSAAALAATWTFARPHGPDGPTPLALAGEIALLVAVAVCVGGPVLLWMLLRGAGDAVLRAAVPQLARVTPVCGALLLAIAVTTADGWELVALLMLAALAVATGLAGRMWMRRRTHTRGLDLLGRMRLRRVAAVATGAAAVALAAATVTATGQSQLAFTGPVDGAQQIHTQQLDVR